MARALEHERRQLGGGENYSKPYSATLKSQFLVFPCLI